MKTLLSACLTLCACVEAPRATWATSHQHVLAWDHLPISWSFSYAFPESEKETFRQGFSYWNDSVNEPVFQEFPCDGVCLGPDPDLLIFKGIELEIDSIFARTTRRVGAPGEMDRATISYYTIWDVASPQSQLSVVRHEAGHVLGLDHTADNHCLMYPEIDPWRKGALEACSREVDLVRQNYAMFLKD